MGLGMDAMGYKLNMAALLNTQVSVEDTLAYGDGQYKGDRQAHLAFLADRFGLENLTEAETARLEKPWQMQMPAKPPDITKSTRRP